MMLAFLSNVNEEHIIDGQYEGDEEERVNKAAQLIIDAPLYVEVLPDFSLQDIENKIKKNVRDHNIKYVFNPKRVWENETLYRLINGVLSAAAGKANGEA